MVITNFPLYLIVLPLFVAFFIFMFHSFFKKIALFSAFLTFLVNGVIAYYVYLASQSHAILVKLANFLPPIGINLFVYKFNGLFVLVIAIVGILVSLYSLYYIKEGDKSRYASLLLLFFTGMNGIFLTGDIFNFFVFFEILSISAFSLVGYENKKMSIEAGFKYLVQASLGSLFFLVAIGLTYSQVGTLNIADIASKIGTITGTMKFLIFGLFLTGLGVETALFPLNFWLPDAHSMAPSSISSILSGLAINAGLYGLIVVFYIIGNGAFLNVLIIVGLITMLIGESLAYRQTNYKRMLAFSSTGQMGLVTMAFFAGSPLLVVAAIFQLVNHIVSKVLLFLSGGYILKDSEGYAISDLKGAFYKYPIASFGIIIGALSLLGIPLTLGFYSKIKILLGFASLNKFVFIALILVASYFEGVYFIKVIANLFQRTDKKKEFSIPFLVNCIFLFLIVVIIILGVYPKLLGNISTMAGDLLNRSQYISEVLNVR